MFNKKIHLILTATLRCIAVTALLAVVFVVRPELPAGETVGQWCWFDRAALLAAACMVCSLWTKKERDRPEVYVSGALVLLGAAQAVLGLLQLYGLAASRHALYALTGTFFNPGPYSGYLAMALPICLHLWLTKRVAVVAGGGMLLILCVLPAGMSRSAWLAAGGSCLWVYGCHAGWWTKLCGAWRQHRRRMLAALAGGCCLLVLAGGLLFALKPDSARGRLFMWKMACRAVAEKPLTGHGIGGFAHAYGEAQEAYFAAGSYAPWEERVAGSPEYAFNEYVQAAVELGVPLTVGLLAGVAGCLRVGIRKRRYGVCGAVLSLMIFACSSYPLQLPAFIVAGGALLVACVADGTRRQWLMWAVGIGAVGGLRLQSDVQTAQACREWMNARMLYQAGAYPSATQGYERLYPLLKGRATFLFEYGHGLHKQQRFAASNHILEEALQRSCDPMILNIIGKNHQQAGNYRAAEAWFVRSVHRLPGRIYPYYLLAKLYAEPAYRHPQKLEAMKQMVLTKEPKVNSTAVRQMREEMN